MLNKLFRFFHTFCSITLLLFASLHATPNNQKVCIVIPAYNEEKRIPLTLETYVSYFDKTGLKVTFLVVANNCSDKTVQVSRKIAKKHKNIEIMDLKPGGKGFALKQGFEWASRKNFDIVGMVDADMATLPEHYYELILAMDGYDGAIASRYIKGAVVSPKRPWGRKVGGKIYNWILKTTFGLNYKDTQCGAKIFTQDTIQKVAPLMQETGWAWDLEFLYLCKLFNKNIVEVPTTWSDQPGSHLTVSSKLVKEFLGSPKRIKKRHQEQKIALKKEALQKKRDQKKKEKEERKRAWAEKKLRRHNVS